MTSGGALGACQLSGQGLDVSGRSAFQPKTAGRLSGFHALGERLNVAIWVDMRLAALGSVGRDSGHSRLTLVVICVGGEIPHKTRADRGIDQA